MKIIKRRLLSVIGKGFWAFLTELIEIEFQHCLKQQQELLAKVELRVRA